MAANTYTLISSNVLASTATSVTFSSIPSTYTDLVLRTSTRTNTATGTGSMFITCNGTSANYSQTLIAGNGSTASSSRLGTQAQFDVLTEGTSYTASTFTNDELYVPSYLASQNKPISFYNVIENNATAAAIRAYALLWQNTATITSITIADATGGQFVANSSFYLYGIKNS